MRTRTLLIACVLLVCYIRRGHAASFLPISDADLTDQAELVAEVEITGADRAPDAIYPSTDYTARVLRVAKGADPLDTITIRSLGGTTEDGRPFPIPGSPHFRLGDRAIVFLVPGPSGTYQVLHLQLGVFREAKIRGRWLAIGAPSRAEPRTESPKSQYTEKTARDADSFFEWIVERDRGAERPAGYRVPLSRRDLKSITSQFTLLGDVFNLPFNGRWFNFDGGGTVVWAYDSRLQSSFPSFLSALLRWTGESETPIRFSFPAVTTTTPAQDGVSAVVIDPGTIIAGSIRCDGNGGMLAVGIPSFVPGVPNPVRDVGRFNKRTFYKINEAEIIINDGAECFLSNPADAEELFAHELGHTLGLGHSCDEDPASLPPPCSISPYLDEALMRWQQHGNQRGGFLFADDIVAIRKLYRSHRAVARCRSDKNTLCLANGRFLVRLDWFNQYALSAGLGRPIPRTNVAGFFSFGDPSNIELILKILNFGDVFKFFYGELTTLKFRLYVLDTATGEESLYYNTDGDCGAIDEKAFPGTLALPVVSGEATAAADQAAASCGPGPNTLCLLNRRFSVQVDWHNQFNGQRGVGSARSMSNLTGSFYFTDPSNEELLVKIIDFGNRIDVFYGVLSNLEYTIRVTDTATGLVKTYHNPPGNYCGGHAEF